MNFRAVAPSRGELSPWTDRRGRFSMLRGVTLALLAAPAAWLFIRWTTDMLGPEPLHAAIHSTGYWTIWLLLASLVVTPFKALAAMPNIVILRRLIGNAALLYALVHITLYATDQHWNVLTIVGEIVKRIYLTIGFVALLGLVVLGLTSTDGWICTLGRTWKRLHKAVYGIAVLGLVHYVLQSKLDVSAAQLAAGAFTWLMLWRMLPAGRDRERWPLVGIAVAAAAMTLVYEYVWYRFGTRVDPMRVVRGEFDIDFGLHPAGQVLILGMLASAAFQLRQLGLTPLGQGLWFTVLLYALGAFVDDVLALFLGWSFDDVLPGGVSPLLFNAAWVLALGLLGIARWRLRDQWRRHLLDAAWLACVIYQVALVGSSDPSIGTTSAALIAGASLLLGQRVWTSSRRAALALVPLGLLLAYGAAAYL